jgi:hypothetical protein
VLGEGACGVKPDARVSIIAFVPSRTMRSIRRSPIAVFSSLLLFHLTAATLEFARAAFGDDYL